jgi:hypothetical protein
MVNKYNKIGVLFLFLGISAISLSIVFRRFSLLVDFGPPGWFQYFIAMSGFVSAFMGLIITYPINEAERTYDYALKVLLILGGLYLIELSFILDLHPRWVDRLLSIVGLIFLIIGLLLYLINFEKVLLSNILNPYLVKILISSWMIILLVCFLLYWGAPIEFWTILDRFGINVEKGGLLRTIQFLLNQFFTYS